MMNSLPTKHIILCADDFGYTSEVSTAIINLAAKKRLSATSCMTNIEGWHELLPDLMHFREYMDIGLHFNLTEGFFLSSGNKMPSLSRIIFNSYFRQFSQTQIENELAAQIEVFQQHCGFLPDYIDGHQHIQQLPIIRNAIIEIVKRKYPTQKPYLRVSSNGFLHSMVNSPKALLLYLLGAATFKHLAFNAKIPTTQRFAGIYNLHMASNYPKLFDKWLQELTHQGLLMCHPGLLPKDDSNDPIAKTRFMEYQFFLSDMFVSILDKNQVVLCRFKNT